LRGENGFGYDPVFFIPEIGKSFAELTLEEKNRISHRGKALAEFKEFLERLI
jgi:XTP/dITP diphosphohydrolase